MFVGVVCNPGRCPVTEGWWPSEVLRITPGVIPIPIGIGEELLPAEVVDLGRVIIGEVIDARFGIRLREVAEVGLIDPVIVEVGCGVVRVGVEVIHDGVGLLRQGSNQPKLTSTLGKGLRQFGTRRTSRCMNQFPIPAPFAQLVALLAVVIIGTGCAVSPMAEGGSAAERLAEGASFNADQAFAVGPVAMTVTGSQQLDLAKLHVAASAVEDHELALAAAIVMLGTSGPDESHLGWRMLGKTVESSDAGLAAAIAQRRLELVAHVEGQLGTGLDSSAAQVRSAVVRRSCGAAGRARRSFDEASWTWTNWGDDERGMQESMLHALEAHALGRTAGLPSQDMLELLGTLGRAESELYAAQAEQVRSTWQDGMQSGQSRFIASLERARVVLEAMKGSLAAPMAGPEQAGGNR